MLSPILIFLAGTVILGSGQASSPAPRSPDLSSEDLARHLIVVHRLSVYRPREQNMPVTAEQIVAAQACKDAVMAGRRFSGARSLPGQLDLSIDRRVDRAADNINRCLTSRGWPVLVIPTSEPVTPVLQ